MSGILLTTHVYSFLASTKRLSSEKKTHRDDVLNELQTVCSKSLALRWQLLKVILRDFLVGWREGKTY